MKSLSYSSFADRIDLEEVEAELGFESIREDNGNDIGYCILPYGLHSNGDTTGKLGIHREKMVYNCWVCGGGSLLDLVVNVKDLDIEQATDWLFQFTGAKQESSEAFLGRIHKTMNPEQKTTTLPYYNERTLDKWATDDHPWLAERGIPGEVAEIFRVGYNPKAKKYAPKQNGVAIDEPFVGEAMVLPHFWKNKLMGWQHRWLTDDRPKWCQKYTNTPDLPRAETLFGFDIAVKVCAKTGQAPVIVESVPTAMFLTGLGYPSIATFGATIKDAQLRHLRAFQNGVILSPDNDKVSDESYWAAARKLRKYVPVQWLDPPDYFAPKQDLGDLSSSPDLARNLIENESRLLLRSQRVV